MKAVNILQQYSLIDTIVTLISAQVFNKWGLGTLNIFSPEWSNLFDALYLTFFKINFFKKKSLRNTIRVTSGLEPDQDWDTLSVLIWVQTLCKGCPQMAKAATSKESVNVGQFVRVWYLLHMDTWTLQMEEHAQSGSSVRRWMHYLGLRGHWFEPYWWHCVVFEEDT